MGGNELRKPGENRHTNWYSSQEGQHRGLRDTGGKVMKHSQLALGSTKKTSWAKWDLSLEWFATLKYQVLCSIDLRKYSKVQYTTSLRLHLLVREYCKLQGMKDKISYCNCIYMCTIQYKNTRSNGIHTVQTYLPSYIIVGNYHKV